MRYGSGYWCPGGGRSLGLWGRSTPSQEDRDVRSSGVTAAFPRHSRLAAGLWGRCRLRRKTR